jgi:hypothetical protein
MQKGVRTKISPTSFLGSARPAPSTTFPWIEARSSPTLPGSRDLYGFGDMTKPHLTAEHLLSQVVRSILNLLGHPITHITSFPVQFLKRVPYLPRHKRGSACYVFYAR